MRRMGFWLVTTEHLKNGLLFKDEEDYKSGMNCVAVTSVVTSTNVLAFILMSNHTHFVIESSYSTVIEFITRFKKNYSQYYSKKYSETGLLKKNKVQIQELKTNDESFERAVAYVQMNSVAANLCLQPSNYQWGTGNLFFNGKHDCNGKKFGELSGRAKKKLLHSTVELPKDFIVDENGYINPASYVKIDTVESIFRTPKRMMYFLNKSSKAQRIINRDLNSSGTPTFNDGLVTAGISDICNSIFHKNSINELNQSQLVELLRQLQYRFSASANQIARVSGLEYAFVSKLLDVI